MRSFRPLLLITSVAVAVLAAALVVLRASSTVPEASATEERDAAAANEIPAGDAPEDQPDSPPESPPPPPPLPPPPPPEPASRPELVQRVAALLDHPDHAVAGTVAVVVLDEHGRVVVDRSGEASLLPASTQKNLVAAAALLALGPEHRFVTELRVSSLAPYGSATAGDLVLVGSGDPALATPLFGAEIYPVRPRTPLEALADAVVAAGIEHVTGDVAGDARAYSRVRPLALGWLDSYLTDLDARYVSALTVDAGLRIGHDEDGELVVELATDPAAEAVARFHELLAERGVTVAGNLVSDHRIPAAPTRVAAVASPPLRDLLRHMVQRSDNHLADQLLHHLGVALAGRGTWAAGDLALRHALEPYGLDWEGVVVADGSGLSRDDRLTARFLAGLELATYRSPMAPEWAGLMAAAGESGTLRARWRDTTAQARFFGKTGTLRDTRTLAGTLVGPAGARYHLAVLGNGLDEPADRQRVRDLMDALVLELAQDLYCVVVEEPDERERVEVRERQLACA